MNNNDNNRIGDWIQTYTGKCFYPLDPRPEEIDIIDIAHSLSMTCRYAGHVERFYSVAEHSVIVSQHVHPKNALWGLLHDATEAYSADIPSPLKKYIPGWKEMERKLMDAVCRKYNLDLEEPHNVKDVDFNICGDEMICLMGKPDREWQIKPKALGVKIHGWNPLQAKTQFLMEFNRLIKKG